MKGMRAAIDAKCKDCLYDPLCGGGTWREQIAKCVSVSCPLWPFRTGPRSGPFADYPTDPASLPPGWGYFAADGTSWPIHYGK